MPITVLQTMTTMNSIFLYDPVNSTIRARTTFTKLNSVHTLSWTICPVERVFTPASTLPSPAAMHTCASSAVSPSAASPPSRFSHTAPLQGALLQSKLELHVTKRPPQESDGLDVTMEPATGLEPATGSLQNCYATIASYRHTKMRVKPLYDNNSDSQSLSHKRYNHQRQDIAGHVTYPHATKRGWTSLP